VRRALRPIKRAVLSARDAFAPEFRHERNVAYGEHRQQILDIYHPHQPVASAAAVLVFLHGGGFRTGAPADNAYQGRAALLAGAMYVAMGYRLAPGTRFPDSVDDVEQGLLWLHANIAARGGDPERLFVAGHSAGAMLAAWAALRQSALPVDLIKGAVLISGVYHDAASALETVDATSPRYVALLSHAIERVPPHTILVVGETEFASAIPDAYALHEALRARGASVELYMERGADHARANRGFISPEGEVFRAVQRMMALDSG
jgi:arylformamidase